MPQGDKSKCAGRPVPRTGLSRAGRGSPAHTGKQKRKAEHIAESYEERGVSRKEAKARAYATVNKDSGGGNKSGSGRGKKDSNASERRGGQKSGSTSASRSAAARKGWETRRRRGNG